MLKSFIAWYKDHMNSLIEWYKDQLVHYGYKLIVLLMAAESSILPIPSEAVIPFAAHQAHTNPNVKLSIAGIILAGTFGSWLGATVMYWTARIAGRPLLLRYGQYALISPNKNRRSGEVDCPLRLRGHFRLAVGACGAASRWNPCRDREDGF